MQNSMEIGTSAQHFPPRTAKDNNTSKRAEAIQEKLRRLQEVLPGAVGDDPLKVAVQHLRSTRQTRRLVSQQGHWNPHHTNYTSGYMDSVRDAKSDLVNNPSLHSSTRSNIAQFISNKQEYRRLSQQLFSSQSPASGEQPANNPNNRYNFYYPAPPQHRAVPASPYTFWKPW